MGTFLSPDTIVPDAGNLFAYNRYLYAYGNPLKFNDPTGHDPCGPGTNPYCDEYQTASAGSGITYQQFLAARQQYFTYINDATAYFADWRTYYGVDPGDISAAFNRITLASLYDQYYAPGQIEYAIGPDAYFTEAERVRSSGSDLEFLYGTALLGPFLAGDDENRNASSGNSINSIDDILNNPHILSPTMGPSDIQNVIDDAVASGKWTTTPLLRGSHAGEGLVIRELNVDGTNYTGLMIQWHPGGGRHGPNPYWKVSTGQGGTIRIGNNLK